MICPGVADKPWQMTPQKYILLIIILTSILACEDIPVKAGWSGSAKLLRGWILRVSLLNIAACTSLFKMNVWLALRCEMWRVISLLYLYLRPDYYQSRPRHVSYCLIILRPDNTNMSWKLLLTLKLKQSFHSE